MTFSIFSFFANFFYPPVSQEKIISYRVHRALFTRLIFSLNRAVNQSLEVLGFLFLLEQSDHADELIYSLLAYPDKYLNKAIKEVIVCLDLLKNRNYETSFFVADINNSYSVIPTIFSLTRGRVNLLSIYQNREYFLLGLRKNLSDFCIRAFGDICARAERYNTENILATKIDRVIKELIELKWMVPEKPIYRLGVQTDETNVEAAKKKGKEVMLPLDDRVFYSTYIKDYPVSEEQVRTYFIRRFKEIIEAVKMEEIEDREQYLYAVMKMHYRIAIREIVLDNDENKFSNDGRHVWVTNYCKSLSFGSSSSSYA